MNFLKPKKIANKFAPTALIILSVVVLIWAVLRADAAWHFYLARSATDSEESMRQVSQALDRFPRNPDYREFAGRLLELQAARPGVVGREREELLQAAAGHYRGALAVRPLWPYGWASLLSVKSKLGEVDPEFEKAMNRAAETGPWEPRVQLQLIHSGLRHWDQLKMAERELVRGKVADALKVQPREVFVIVREYGRSDLLCGLETGQGRIERWCEQI